MREENCTYKDERYSVRDNGELLRHSKDGKKKRPLDNNWTHGKLNEKTGYMEIASVSIHRIVATAFHGLPPTKEHVVDHIDTNKRNNRPENLRWVTRLENILLNPITVRKIEIVCGSIEVFLEEPSRFRNDFKEPNYNWMCNVSKQEAQISLEKMLAWAKSEKVPSGGSLGEWIFNRTKPQNKNIEITPETSELTISITKNSRQVNWRTPSEFPCCPQVISGNPISSYALKLKTGLIFCKNNYYTSKILKIGISNDKQSLYVITESDNLKRWALAKITYENELFIHTSINSFFEQIGAEKQFTLGLGLEWYGEDSIDDFC